LLRGGMEIYKSHIEKAGIRMLRGHCEFRKAKKAREGTIVRGNNLKVCALYFKKLLINKERRQAKKGLIKKMTYKHLMKSATRVVQTWRCYSSERARIHDRV